MEGGLIKSSFITNDEMKACKLTSTKFPQKIVCNFGIIKIYKINKKIILLVGMKRQLVQVILKQKKTKNCDGNLLHILNVSLTCPT